MEEIKDILIIGGGPAGLYAAFAAGVRQQTVALFEALPELGGKTSFYSERLVWELGGTAPVSGKKIREQLIRQAKLFAPQIYCGTQIIALEKAADRFAVTDQKGQRYYGKTLLLCTGSGIFAPKKLTCKMTAAARARIFYQAPPAEQLAGKQVLFFTSRSDAAEEALKLTAKGAAVTLCCRSRHLQADEEQLARLRQAQITVLTGCRIQQADNANQQIRLTLRRKEVGECVLQGDYLIAAQGYDQDTSLLDTTSLPFQKQAACIACTVPTKTNIAGIYTAGDSHYYEGKLNLLSGAFHDAMQAVANISQYLDPDSSFQGTVSTHNSRFTGLVYPE